MDVPSIAFILEDGWEKQAIVHVLLGAVNQLQALTTHSVATSNAPYNVIRVISIPFGETIPRAIIEASHFSTHH